LIGRSFNEGAQALLRSGAKGLAVLDQQGATRQGVEALRARGILPVAYNNAFQAQRGERIPGRAMGHDGAWGEAVPDFRNPAWQARRIGQAVDAARKGFAGVMLDNVTRAGGSGAGADFVRKMVDTARAYSGNPRFTAILQNGDKMIRANPWLAHRGYVSALQQEDISYRTNGGRGGGLRVASSDRAEMARSIQAIRRQHPNLPLIAVDYPASTAQAAESRARARALGFNVSHLAYRDGHLENISRATAVFSRMA
jgi:endo-alpha-1,4-polygalactosaminidase (GH114 family)